MDKKWFEQIDLLRLVLMYMIVVFHIVSRGGVISNTEFLSPRFAIMVLIYTVTSCAVNSYALVSGYVGIDSKKSGSGFALLWMRVVWYGVLIALGFAVFSSQNVGWTTWAKAVFPVSFRAYWYFTAYFILVIFQPLLNAAVRNVSKAQLGGMILVLLVFVGVPAAINRDAFQLAKGFSAWWLIILYLLGAYIRLYGLIRFVKTRHLWLIFIMVNALELFRRLVYNYFYFKLKGEIPFYENMTNYTAVTTVIAAVCLFLIFERINMKGRCLGRCVRKLASSSFSVYLIHVNHLVWNKLLADNFSWISEFGAVLSCVLVFAISALVFIGCLLIDLPREALFKKLQIRSRLDCAGRNIIMRINKHLNINP